MTLPVSPIFKSPVFNTSPVPAQVPTPPIDANFATELLFLEMVNNPFLAAPLVGQKRVVHHFQKQQLGRKVGVDWRGGNLRRHGARVKNRRFKNRRYGKGHDGSTPGFSPDPAASVS